MRMKLRLLLKSIALTTLFLIAGHVGWGQVLLQENFDYTAGTFLTANGWTAHSGTGTTPIQVVSPGLNFSGYASSGIGLAAGILNNGEDVNRAFTEQTSGAVYVSFMMQAAATNSAGYFLHLGQTLLGSTFISRVWVNATGTGVAIGGTTPTTYIPITPGDSYLLVVKYDITSKVSSLFVFSSFPLSEPAIANQTFTETATITGVGSIALRQFNAAEKVIVDGIRVAANWADAVAKDVSDATAPIGTFSPANAATGVLLTDNITISFDEAIRNTDNSTIDDSNVGSLITLKETDGAGANVPFTATINAFKKIITINPDADLANSKTYYVAIANIEDLNDNLTAGSSITFTTVASSTPSISGVAITETAPYYAGSSLTVTWTSANVDFVKIELWVPSSASWVEKIASTTSDGSESITLPADAMYSTEYKVRVSYVTDALVNGESTTFTVIATPTINDIQSKMSDADKSIYNGHTVRINGIVTARKASASGYFVQSGTGSNNGIYVYAAPGTLAVGDDVTILGTVTEYLSTTLYLTEIIPTSLVVNSSGNTLPAATTITTGQMLEAYEGVLVKIVNAEVKSVPDANGVFTIDDGSGVTSVDNDFYTHTPAVGDKLTITGLGYYSFGAFKVLPRDASDIVVLKTGKDILTFDFAAPAVVGTVNATDHTVALTVPFGTVLTALVPTITISEGATISPLSGVATDFTGAVTYTVTAEDLTTQVWTVTVTVTAGRTGKDILTFNFATPAVVGTVNATDHTVTLTVPSSTVVTALVPTITISDGATISPLTGVAADFTAPVNYTVTAEDLSTQVWTVTVNIATGFENHSNLNFKVYPNPFNNEVKLEGFDKQCRVSVQSLNGQVLIDKLITNKDNTINTQSLKSGVYMITIVDENGEKLTKKMLKE